MGERAVITSAGDMGDLDYDYDTKISSRTA